jgi:hypothetical protein
MARDARLSILTAQEVDELYRLPRFTEADRRLYFDLSTAELKLVDDVVTLSVAVHLVLQLGYFKAKRQFFVYGLQAVVDDLEHILRRHFSARHLSEINPLSKPTRLEQQRAILKLFDYRSCDAGAKKELEGKAQRVAMLSAQPVFILREALQYLAQRRLVAPGYTYLQDMVGRTVSGERFAAMMREAKGCREPHEPDHRQCRSGGVSRLWPLQTVESGGKWIGWVMAVFRALALQSRP